MMRVVIIDDIKQARKALHHDLIDYCDDVCVVGEADNVKEALLVVNDQQPDLIFLDIDLGDGTTGFDILSQLKRPPKVIFTTAFDHFAIKAFKFGAIDYLLKPIDEAELVDAVKKAKEVTFEQVDLGHKMMLKEQIDKVIISHQDELVIVPIVDVLSCEASNNYTIFHLQDKTVISSETLKHYDALFDNNGFYRCHHSHLVNLSHVKSVVKKDGGYLVLSSGKEVPVSSRKRDALYKKIKTNFLN